MTRIVLHIDRLVLRGIDQADAEAFTQALRDELSRQLETGLVGRGLRTFGDRYRLDAGRIHITRNDDAQALGRAIAARIVETGLS
ncbi:TPA: hypothetical protein SAN82_003342 [Pseudomonas putida]|nr:hypothetical protein [Pseudomonas putida]